MDRVKAAIFSSLGPQVIDADVLDLFAGTGALGIEALSRGAATATFVESSRTTARVIERNLTTAKLQGRIRVQDVFRFLRSGAEIFDIVLADPPYEKTSSGESYTALLLHDPSLVSLLRPDGALVLEKRPGEPLPPLHFWKLDRARRYGATEVLFLSPVATRQAALGSRHSS